MAADIVTPSVFHTRSLVCIFSPNQTAILFAVMITSKLPHYRKSANDQRNDKIKLTSACKKNFTSNDPTLPRLKVRNKMNCQWDYGILVDFSIRPEV